MLPVIEITLPPQIQGGNVPAFLAKLWKMVDNPDAGNGQFISGSAVHVHLLENIHILL